MKAYFSCLHSAQTKMTLFSETSKNIPRCAFPVSVIVFTIFTTNVPISICACVLNPLPLFLCLLSVTSLGTSRDEMGKGKRSNCVQMFHLILLIITGKKRKEKDSILSDHQCTIKWQKEGCAKRLVVSAWPWSAVGSGSGYRV
jgi:hypothetical protein